MITEINRNRNEPSCILMHMLKEEFVDEKCQIDNFDVTKIDNVKIIEIKNNKSEIKVMTILKNNNKKIMTIIR